MAVFRHRSGVSVQPSFDDYCRRGDRSRRRLARLAQDSGVSGRVCAAVVYRFEYCFRSRERQLYFSINGDSRIFYARTRGSYQQKQTEGKCMKIFLIFIELFASSRLSDFALKKYSIKMTLFTAKIRVE